MSDEHVTDGAAFLADMPIVARMIDRCIEASVPLDGVYVVGGAVRDAMLGAQPGRDVDLAVEGSAADFARVLVSAVGGDVVAEHEFGTATIVAPLGADDALVRIDLASCRTETYSVPGALPSVELGASIDADLARRDVTANAVAISLAAGSDSVTHRLVDPHAGREAIHNRVLRVIHDASFRDDPTRIFRVARYAGRLGFRVDEHTRTLAVDAVAANALADLSADRLRAELELVLQEQAWDALTLLASWGVVERLDPRLEQSFRSPFLVRQIDAATGGDPQLDSRVWTMRLAALARPLGDDLGGWMRWLGFPGDVVSTTSEYVHVLNVLLEAGEELLALPNSELYQRLGEVSDEAFALAALARPDDVALVQRLTSFREAIRSVGLSVRGEDVIAAGVPAGPMVGRILGDLFLRSLDGELAGEADERAALAIHAERVAQEGEPA